MTRRNSAAKRAARNLSRAEGIPYSVARRREADQTRQRLPRVPDDALRPRNIDEVLHEHVQSWCAQQLGEPVTDTLWPDPDTTTVLGVELIEPTVHELTAVDDQTYSTPIEEHEGGTVVSTVTAFARMTVDGLLERSTAIGADGHLFDVLDDRWNDHYSAVLAHHIVEVELQFNAVTNPDYEGVEDLELVEATVLGRVR